MRLLIAGRSPELPPVLRELVDSYGAVVLHVPTLREARDSEHLAIVDAVLVCDPDAGSPALTGSSEFHLLADALISHRLTAIVMWPDTSGGVPGDDDAFMFVSQDISVEELWGRLATARRFRPQLRQMEHQVAAMQRLGKKLNEHFVEVDQELRLASRLQRDFLPKELPEIDDIRFAALYRPATWVSGDIYDVRRLDESHAEFFLADAIGHGVAAGLLTMFIKQAIAGKRIGEGNYTIIGPGEVLAALNNDLAAHQLPNCQFITGCYAIINTQTHELTFARGGHPHPIHVSAAGHCREVRTVGGLLGLFPNEEFASATLHLEPGEKFIMYSDGLESIVLARPENRQSQARFTQTFQNLARRPASDCIDSLGKVIDRLQGSLQPDDDQTCLIVERLPR